MTPRSRAFLSLPATLLAAACTVVPPAAEAPSPSPADLACIALIDAFDAEVARAGIGDGAYARVDGFRTLRVDRLVASYDAPPMDAERFGAWVAAMRALDRDARDVQLANLPNDARARIDELLRTVPRDDASAPVASVDACAERVLEGDLSAGDARMRLIRAVVRAVP